MKKLLQLAAGSLVLLAASALAQDKITLKAGDAAPKLSVSQWVGGEPVNEFAAGTIYVIDCWATWCGPCIQSMPHLSALNTRYKDKGVVVIGLNVDQQSTQAKVPAFIAKNLAEDVNFVVGLDTFEKRESRAWTDWLFASGNRGIPTTFIVDKLGKLAWIGHPMKLDEVLGAVVAGTFDVAAYAERAKLARKLEAGLQNAFRSEDWDQVLQLMDEFIAIQPAGRRGMYKTEKVRILLSKKRDYEAGYALAQALLTGDLADDDQALNAIAYEILTAKGIKERNFDLALKIALRADKLTDHASPFVLDTLALAYFKAGDTEKAIELQTLAVAKAADDERLQAELQSALERFQGNPNKKKRKGKKK
jgi:thiol-disulfide isomerase/thioredoxin